MNILIYSGIACGVVSFFSLLAVFIAVFAGWDDARFNRVAATAAYSGVACVVVFAVSLVIHLYLRIIS